MELSARCLSRGWNFFRFVLPSLIAPLELFTRIRGEPPRSSPQKPVNNSTVARRRKAAMIVENTHRPAMADPSGTLDVCSKSAKPGDALRPQDEYSDAVRVITGLHYKAFGRSRPATWSNSGFAVPLSPNSSNPRCPPPHEKETEKRCQNCSDVLESAAKVRSRGSPVSTVVNRHFAIGPRFRGPRAGEGGGTADGPMSVSDQAGHSIRSKVSAQLGRNCPLFGANRIGSPSPPHENQCSNCKQHRER